MDHLMMQRDEQGNETKSMESTTPIDFKVVCHYHGPRPTARSLVYF